MTRRCGTLGLAALGCALLFSGLARNTAAASEPAPRPKPRLVLFVSVDQMRFDYLTRFAPLFKDGFKTLLARGAVFSEAYYRHANTETGPGHSVLLSGRHASASGIVANAWYDRLRHASVNVVDDPVQAPVGGQGRAASPANFLGVSVGDLLKKISPDSRVFGVSLKDRAAVLMGGRRADGAFWYDASSGRFMTSTYYVKRAPEWLDTWNGERQADAFFGKLWTRLLPDEAVYRRYAGEDAVVGEGDGQNDIFPHAIPGAAQSSLFYDELRRTPFADELTLDVALRVVDAYGLGRGSATDLLAVGFSATDVIGHTYGADSQEILDQLLRLDGLLGRLFREADARVGPGHTLIGLSADHGSMPLVEVLKARGIDARRAAPSSSRRPSRRRLRSASPARAASSRTTTGPTSISTSRRSGGRGSGVRTSSPASSRRCWRRASWRASTPTPVCSGIHPPTIPTSGSSAPRSSSPAAPT